MLPLLFKAPRKKYIPKINVTFVKITNKKTHSHTQTVTLLTADGRTCSSFFFLLKRRVLFYNFAGFINFLYTLKNI